ncbi:hypothetical protein [Streptosporangium amethystogenes]|nr:hypothetical protein [Streptosporangium amethystogenes]
MEVRYVPDHSVLSLEEARDASRLPGTASSADAVHDLVVRTRLSTRTARA